MMKEISMHGTYLPGDTRQRIQDLIKNRRITQAELAKKVGLSNSALSRYLQEETAKLLYTGRVDASVLNQLIEHPRFPQLLLLHRNLLRIERTLAGVIQHISVFFYAWMLSTFPELRPLCSIPKWQIPQLNAIVGLIAYGKALIFRNLESARNGFFLAAANMHSPFFPFSLLSSIETPDNRAQPSVHFPQKEHNT